ncbi:MAG: hypothetical protein ABID38_00020 [Candidatus Diapherotrites archaeon]
MSSMKGRGRTGEHGRKLLGRRRDAVIERNKQGDENARFLRAISKNLQNPTPEQIAFDKRVQRRVKLARVTAAVKNIPTRIKKALMGKKRKKK